MKSSKREGGRELTPEEKRREALVILARIEEAARALHSETAMDLQLQVEEPHTQNAYGVGRDIHSSN